MKCKIFVFICVATITLLLAACGSNGPALPKAGHWEGSNPPVSFDVSIDGYIKNFTMSVLYASDTIDIFFESTAAPADKSVEWDIRSLETLTSGSLNGDFYGTRVSGKYLITMAGQTISLNPRDTEERDWSAEWKSQ
jgi:hypothetical protein